MQIILWAVFLLLIVLLLVIDLGVFHRKSRIVYAREAIVWTIFWVFLSLAFNVLIYYLYEHDLFGIASELGHKTTGKQAALSFFTGYLLEKSLSLDNIFIIAMIFAYFKVDRKYQHRVLYWGILGAIVLRGVMIIAGTALIAKFFWMNYIFGALLIISAIKMLITRHDNIEPDKNPFVKFVRRFFPVSGSFHEDKFIFLHEGRRLLTPLFVVLVVIESTDVMFAMDSIPAIFAVTHDPFIVFTSNIFAILGLRSLYFALAAIMDKFRYLKMSLVFVLAYVGIKMILAHHYPVKTVISLSVIVTILFVGIAVSIYASHRDTARLKSPL